MSSTLQAATARLLIAGAAPDGTTLMECRTEQTRYGRGDSYEATLSLSPGAARWWDVAGGAGIDATIQMALLAGPTAAPSWMPMIRGPIDDIDWQPDTGLLHVTGRDYISRLRAQAVQTAWLNHTGSEILVLLIQAAGLMPDVQLAAADAITGAFYTTQHKRSAAAGRHKFSSAFDLARHLVDEAACDMWADGLTVRVRPRPTGAADRVITYVPPASVPYAVVPVWDLHLKRDLQVDRGVIVSVQSWDSRQRQVHAFYWSKKGGSRTMPSDANADVYPYTLAGASDAEVQAKAAQRYAEIVAHARQVSFDMTGDLTLMARELVQFGGTGSSWDDTYGVDEVSRSYSVEAGITQSVLLRTRVTPTEDDSSE